MALSLCLGGTRMGSAGLHHLVPHLPRPLTSWCRSPSHISPGGWPRWHVAGITLWLSQRMERSWPGVPMLSDSWACPVWISSLKHHCRYPERQDHLLATGPSGMIRKGGGMDGMPQSVFCAALWLLCVPAHFGDQGLSKITNHILV